MKGNKRIIITGVIAILIVAFLGAYRLPYYVYKPGTADALDPIVEVDNGYKSEGDMHLVTVRGGQATPLQWLIAKIRPYQEIYPIEQIRPEGISEEEYFHAQLRMMESSQEAAKVVAYKAADKQVNINYEGVYVVNTLKGMPAEKQLKGGDQILKIDGNKIKESADLIQYVEKLKKGDTVSLTIKRKDKTLTKDVKLAPFPNEPDRIGVGISLVTDRSIDVKPKVKVKSGEIGGPSAGLMFSLEMYDQLTKGDLTQGKQICGTGEITYDGQVGKIGGIDKKVVAANKEGCSVFFAPNEEGREDSNYQVAKTTAKDLHTDMKVVPVDTFNDALTYLKKM
ncbi:PDZ domain-containing protein [Halobacillus salinarum]|uniref:endopeptidase La n=1 Tax=Halobacillus salinarum TaxID=2932257 RepID=A0ABY4EFA2_9BACI|nr:SepM family pheromone-processing serine protease [Halobacillus salinarum]UOQ43149.1 PDZ domain-containing protein [Halobacillus salinarum]